MEYTIHTPKAVDVLINALKSAGHTMSHAAKTIAHFCSVHAPVILFAAGCAAVIGGFILAWFWRTKKYEEKKERIIKTATPIAVFVLGLALQIVGMVIAGNRINALSKALTAAMNAGAALCTAEVIGKNADATDEEKAEAAEQVEAARNIFRYRVTDTRVYNENDPYNSIVILKNQLANASTRIVNFGSVTWNEVLQSIFGKSVPEGYTIGWTNVDEFKYVIVDPYGVEQSMHEFVREALTNDLQGWYIYFLGMHSLADKAYKVEGE